jgi:hypothetical protein
MNSIVLTVEQSKAVEMEQINSFSIDDDVKE